MFVKDIKTVILMKTSYQHDAEEEKENKIQGFSKNFLTYGFVYQNLGN
jgi:hypothetical protein